MQKEIWVDEKLTKILKSGWLAVMPTDTLYGVVTSALNAESVLRLHELRKKKSGKPCIILIDSVDKLKNFSINLSEKQNEEIKKYWPTDRATTIIFDCDDDQFAYLHRGTKSLAFRIPNHKGLQDLLKQTGPLLAPSANTEGLPPAQNINEARNYFGDSVDFYLDGGEIVGTASKIIKLEKEGTVTVLRD